MRKRASRPSAEGFIDAGRFYRWPGGVQRALGIGRTIYRLRTITNLPLVRFGQYRFARGQDVIEALENLDAIERSER